VDQIAGLSGARFSGVAACYPYKKGEIMAASQNFTVKVDLHDANVIRRALAERMESLRVDALLSPEDEPEAIERKRDLGAEMMDLERIIRLNFPK